jgi:putative hydrolase of the HAD superfamily
VGAVPSARARIRAVLFDLGGTLIEERHFDEWVDAARECLLDTDPERLAEAYRAVELEVDATPIQGLSPHATVVVHWGRVLSRATDRTVPSATAERFLDEIRRRDVPVRLYSDARRCLDRLSAERRLLGIVSNSSSEARVRTLLDRAGILDYFSRVVSSGTEGVAKPDPEIFRRAVERLGVAPEEAFFVGNLASTDARAARAAGLHSVWLNRDGTGFGDDPPEITSLLELPTWVRRLEASPPAGGSAAGAR